MIGTPDRIVRRGFDAFFYSGVLVTAACTHNLAAEFSTPHYERAPTTTVSPAPAPEQKDGQGGDSCTNRSQCPRPPRWPTPSACATCPACPACPGCPGCPQCPQLPPSSPGCGSGGRDDGGASAERAPISDSRTIVTSAPAGELIPWAAAATLLGAAITGLFALLQLITSKETKVSEFRQEWIDGLRSDVADYIGAVRLLVEVHVLHKRVRQERIGDLFQQTVNAQTRVQLRLKSRENEQHQDLVDKIEQIRTAANQVNEPRDQFLEAYREARSSYAVLKRAEKSKNATQIQQANADYEPLRKKSDALSDLLAVKVKATGDRIEELKDMTVPVLDHEWDKVKEGERRYVLLRRSVKAGCIVALALFLLFLVIAIWPYLPKVAR